MEKFEGKVKPGGLIVYESTNILHASERKDIEIYPNTCIRCGQQSSNNIKVANMVLLGAYLAKQSDSKNRLDNRSA